MKLIACILTLLFVTLPVQAVQPKKEKGLLQLDYTGFTVWLDCSKRGAVKFQYNAQRDSGSEKRSSTFKLDPDVPKECQQLTADAYGNGYDRGHLVPANHLDASREAIQQTNTMTNILPQTSQMNRGAWLATEELIECYRDITPITLGNRPLLAVVEYASKC